jgi:hypothetical protein
MYASLRALLHKVIDYAGLFPPAKLPLAQSIHNYLRYLGDPDRWILGRFVCPVERLEELAGIVQSMGPSGPPVEVSALGAARSADAFAAGFALEVGTFQEISWFLNRVLTAPAYEVRLPSELAHTANISIVDGKALCSIHFEANLDSEARSWLPRLLAALREATGGRYGFKLRCGGLEAAAFPTSEQVAFIIVACRDAGIPLKFTAGLHHPIRHFDESIQVRMHGFINVFAAGALAHVRRLNEEQVQAIIDDDDARHFVFSDAAFRWKDWQATTSEIEAARRMLVSFGSCSFDEPREDLRRLGWL